ncbi:pyrimidine 2, partial [Prunus dulcis]
NSYVGPLTSSNCFHPQAVDVHGIHHRATHNLSASSQVKSFGIGQNTGETLPNFRQKSKEILKRNWSTEGKKVICARHLPGVGHAQDLARIPKWKMGRVLSESPLLLWRRLFIHRQGESFNDEV